MTITKLRSMLARPLVVCTAIALIPLIYAGLLLWSNIDSTHRLSAISAAVVNADQPVENPAGGTHQIGEDLTAKLVSSTDTTNFTWSEMTAGQAAKALETGEVLAVLSIPTDFSQAATSSSESGAAAKARLTIQTNDGANLIAGNIAQTIGNSVTETLRTQLSQNYLEQVYLGFTEIHSNIANATDGASQVSIGAKTTAQGSLELVSGLEQLAEGNTTLTNGAATLASRLDSSEIGAGRVASGAKDLSTGAAALSASVTELGAGVTSLSAGTDAALAGAQRLQSGAAAAVNSVNEINAGVEQLIANYEFMNDEQRLAGLRQLSAATGSLADKDGVGLESLLAGANALVGGPDSGLTRLAAGAHTAADGANAVAAKSGELATRSTQLAAGAEELAVGTTRASQGAETLAAGTQSASTGAQSALAGATALNTGIGTLETGTHALTEGLRNGSSDIPVYSDTEASELARVTADPVELEAERLNALPKFGHGLAPYFMALSLWVGSMAFYSVMPALRLRLLKGRTNPMAVALRSFAPGALMAAAQSVLLVAIVRFGLGIEFANLPGALGIALLTSLTFFAINQALIALLGTPGRFLGLIFSVLQFASAGGTYPIETSPSLFQVLSNWLPLSHPVAALRSMIAGGSIGAFESVLVLLCWLVGALLVTSASVMKKRHAASKRFATPTTTYVRGQEILVG